MISRPGSVQFRINKLEDRVRLLFNAADQAEIQIRKGNPEIAQSILNAGLEGKEYEPEV